MCRCNVCPIPGGKAEITSGDVAVSTRNGGIMAGCCVAYPGTDGGKIARCSVQVPARDCGTIAGCGVNLPARDDGDEVGYGVTMPATDGAIGSGYGIGLPSTDECSRKSSSYAVAGMTTDDIGWIARRAAMQIRFVFRSGASNLKQR